MKPELITRRSFIAITAGIIAAPAIVKYENIMRIHDPLVQGIRFQTWPFDQEPKFGPYISGSERLEYMTGRKEATLFMRSSDGRAGGVTRPTDGDHGHWVIPPEKRRLSSFMPTIHEHRKIWSEIYWKEIW